MAAAELESPWASVDENVRACVLLHLEPRDLAQVSCLSCPSRSLGRCIHFGSCCLGGGVGVYRWPYPAAHWRERPEATWCGPPSSYGGSALTFGARTPLPTPTTYMTPLSAHIPFPFPSGGVWTSSPSSSLVVPGCARGTTE
jgi:hypothetical protein